MGNRDAATAGPWETSEWDARSRHVYFFPPQPAAKTLPPRQRRVISERGRAAPPQPSLSAEQAALLRGLLARAGLRLEWYRPAPLVRRLAACLRRLRTRSVAEAHVRLEDHPELWTSAVNALMIGVTSLWRDPGVFVHLEQEVLPRLAANRGVRVWSVGCADGSELYSVAMLLHRQGRLAGSRLLGTDCRPEAIAAARRGRFEAERITELPARLADECLRRAHGGWQVVPPVQHATEWRVANALGDAPESSPWDMILCRNLAIYLEAGAVSLLWQRLAAALRPGGVLVVGKAERPRAEGLVRTGPCVFERRE